MAAFSSVKSIATASYPSAAQFTIELFQPKAIRVMNVDAAADVYVSLDGVNDHAMLLSDVLSPMCQHEFRFQMAQKVWVRTQGGVATKVQVLAEG